MKKICCIGHITLDRIITPDISVNMPGGTAFYFAHGMHSLNGGNNFELVTSVGESELGSVEEIRKLGIKATNIPSRKTVFFENKYGHNHDNRTQRVLAKADPFTAEKLQNTDADIYHLGTLLADDFPIEVFKTLSKKGILSVDAQGFLREVQGEKVVPIDWKNKKEYLQYIDILKVNEFEIESLTGYTDPIDAGKQLADWGIKEACITLGSYGSVIYSNGKATTIPAYPIDKIVDATGCGDTYSTGYLYKRANGCSLEEAGHFAAAMSAIKLQAAGPFKGTIADIESIIEKGE